METLPLLFGNSLKSKLSGDSERTSVCKLLSLHTLNFKTIPRDSYHNYNTITLLIFPGGFFHLVRYTWMSEFLTSLELDMLGLARYNIYIPFIVTSRRFSNFLIVSHPSFLKTGVLWSNFLVYVKMRAAKFCISCSLWRLIFDVPAHTVEQ